MAAEPPSPVDRAVERLRAGLVVAFPTETVYGLGADALREDAVRRVFDLKGRPAHNPLIVHVVGEAMVGGLVANWPSEAAALAERFWPGPLTIVLPKSGVVPSIVTAGGRTIGVRCPDHPLALELIRRFGGPLVGPSANPSGSISPTTPEHVRAAFRGDDVLVLDGGACRAGLESTVLSLAGPEPRVLRRGVISAEAISAVIGRPVTTATDAPASAGRGGPLASPGMLARHYAPRARAVLFDPEDWPEIVEGAAGSVVVITHERSRLVGEPHVVLRLPRDPEGYAARLYAVLHEADALAPSLIAIERPSGVGGLWDAVRDRLDRACHPMP